jgi:hypothetical protein
MPTRRLILPLLFLFLSAVSAQAATYRTPNFDVEAANDKLAHEFGDMAEHYRKVKAEEWLGHEMATWSRRCKLIIQIGPNGPAGATTFDFSRNPIEQTMRIEGPRERLLNSVLPHEVTHTVFAHYFKRPLPRWADEGGSVLSEDDIERTRHDQLCRQLLNQGRAMRLNYLFSLMDYPNDVMVLYAEGFSVSRYLVEKSDRATFLQFVAQGMNENWNSAAQTFYGVNVNQLEANWISTLKKTRPTGTVIASNNRTSSGSDNGTELTGRRVTRSTDPPAYPDLSPTSARGSGATLGTPGERFGSPSANFNRPANSAPVNPPRVMAPEPPLPPPLPVQLQTPAARLGTPTLGRPQ